MNMQRTKIPSSRPYKEQTPMSSRNKPRKNAVILVLHKQTKNKHLMFNNMQRTNTIFKEDRYQERTPLFKNIQITTPCSHDFALPSNFAIKDFMEVCEEVATNLQILLDFMCVLGGACFDGA
jgi:hypothetical protein